MSTSNLAAFSATFGSVTVAVSDAYFMVEPAAAVIVSANSHLRTASGGAEETARVAGQEYERACAALLQGHPDGLLQAPPGSPAVRATATRSPQAAAELSRPSRFGMSTGSASVRRPRSCTAPPAQPSPSPTMQASRAWPRTSGPSATGTEPPDQRIRRER